MGGTWRDEQWPATTLKPLTDAVNGAGHGHSLMCSQAFLLPHGEAQTGCLTWSLYIFFSIFFHSLVCEGVSCAVSLFSLVIYCFLKSNCTALICAFVCFERKYAHHRCFKPICLPFEMSWSTPLSFQLSPDHQNNLCQVPLVSTIYKDVQCVSARRV